MDLKKVDLYLKWRWKWMSRCVCQELKNKFTDHFHVLLAQNKQKRNQIIILKTKQKQNESDFSRFLLRFQIIANYVQQCFAI